jgi:catechol 2,3-dioxygenase-like lactoylglutathione lyase family enzyme
MSTAAVDSRKHLAQIAWVVPDITAAERFFQKTLQFPSFARMEHLKAEDLEGSYRGAPAKFEFHLALAISAGWMVELIQPVSGRSIYQDFLDQRHSGGVHHVAYTVAEADFDRECHELSTKGYRVVQSMRLPVARVAYFDTEDELGVLTEIIGVTAAGVDLLATLSKSPTKP